MHARLLGTAAGGGFPQWNCACPTCSAARAGDGRALPRTQSSLAVRAAGGPWLLVNASPDVRQQLETLPAERPNSAVRASPVAAVLLTDAELDHCAGLVVLRESTERLRVLCTDAVRDALTVGFPVLRVLEGYAGVVWERLEAGSTVALPGGVDVEAFAAGGDPPLYMRGVGEAGAVGLTFRDRAGGVLTYAPALAGLDRQLLDRFAASGCLLVDGTFWSDDELPALGISRRTAREMGHLPLAGPNGLLEGLATLAGRRMILVHINNTNPILLEDSGERRAVEAAGLEVGRDGLEIEL